MDRWSGLNRWCRERGTRIFIEVLLILATLVLATAWLDASLSGHGHFADSPFPFLLLPLVGGVLIYWRIVPAFRDLERVERRLGESLRHTELLLQNVGQGIYGIDIEGRGIFLNRAAERLLGYEAREVVGQPVHGLIHHRHPDGSPYPVTECPVHLAMREGVVAHRDADVFWRKDGRPLEVEYVAAPVVDEARVTGAVVLFGDIGERRRAEAERARSDKRLRESEASLAQAQAQAKLGSWRIEPRDNSLEWSAETYRIFGIAPESQVTYARFLDRVHPDDRDYVDTEWQAALRGQPYDIQHRLLVNGQVKWVRERADLEFGEAGGLVHAVGTVQDITELKAKEEELLRSRQLLRELAAHGDRIREVERTRIAREIHDELGQYLTALRMDVAMLGIRYGGDNPELADHAKNMKETIDTTIAVVRHVAATLRPAALDMGLVSATEWLLANFQERTGVACVLDVVEDELNLDDDRTTAVFRILQESLTNIARHAKASKVTVTMAREGDELCVQVADDGVGFDAKLVRQKKTFGLMGIRERAIVFGGESRLDSRPGGGTTLTIRLPLGNTAVP